MNWCFRTCNSVMSKVTTPSTPSQTLISVSATLDLSSTPGFPPVGPVSGAVSKELLHSVESGLKIIQEFRHANKGDTVLV